MSTEAQAQAAARRARAEPGCRRSTHRGAAGGGGRGYEADQRSCLVGALSCVRVLIGFGCHMRCSHNIRFHVPHIDRYRLDVTLVWTVECA